jgi:rSAM/selenodomain-associated transferase 2
VHSDCIPAQPTLSIVVPVLNEAQRLPGLLASLRAQQGITLQIIVSDGGSEDDSRAIARGARVTLVKTSRGRGAQMNAGARRARGDYLLFLHADSGIRDTQLLSRALAALGETATQRHHHRIAGHFPLRFRHGEAGMDLDRRPPLAFRYLEAKTTLNRPYTINGDQGFLLSRGYFHELGGFDEDLPFLEDQRLAAKIRATGEWITLPGFLETSARRFETEGCYRRLLLMAIIMTLHHAGIHEFFERAPHVYRAQHETGRLLLTPFFRLIREILKERSPRGRLDGWLRIGRFVRESAWQPFFFVDVMAAPLPGYGHCPLTRLHDRLLGPLMGSRVCEAFISALAFLGTWGILHPFFRLYERRELRR